MGSIALLLLVAVLAVTMHAKSVKKDSFRQTEAQRDVVRPHILMVIVDDLGWNGVCVCVMGVSVEAFYLISVFSNFQNR